MGLSSSFQGQLVPICAYIVMALSLNLTVGISGELSLGHAGFMSVGALFRRHRRRRSSAGGPLRAPVRLVIAMIVGALLAGLAGVIVVCRCSACVATIWPSLRWPSENHQEHCSRPLCGRGRSRSALPCKARPRSAGRGGRAIIKGAHGEASKAGHLHRGFILVLIALTVVQSGQQPLRPGHHGAAGQPHRRGERGIGVTKYKLMAFVTSAALAGAGRRPLRPELDHHCAANKFDFNTSILVLVFVVLGGLGNIWAPSSRPPPSPSCPKRCVSSPEYAACWCTPWS